MNIPEEVIDDVSLLQFEVDGADCLGPSRRDS